MEIQQEQHNNIYFTGEEKRSDQLVTDPNGYFSSYWDKSIIQKEIKGRTKDGKIKNDSNNCDYNVSNYDFSKQSRG